MIKSFMEFIATGAVVIVGYFIYFVSIFILTVIIGLPIAMAIKILINMVGIIFTGSIQATQI